MVGYLNAPDPFDAEGWMCTGDEVEIKDGYMRFLGRKTEVINTGGKKVYPIEVENVLMSLPNIRNATVEARPHPIMGQVVRRRRAPQRAVQESPGQPVIGASINLRRAAASVPRA